MAVEQKVISVKTPGQGLHSITVEIQDAVIEMTTGSGLLNVFIQHTSASLLIQENADPSAQKDLEEFINRVAPEGEAWHRHLDEGPDDTVSHLKSAITPGSLIIPVRAGKLMLGTWQGIYVWEHRRAPHTRKLVLTVLS